MSTNPQELPAGIEWMHGHAEASAWLADLPRVIEECARQWNLRVGRPFDSAYVSVPLRAVTADGTEVVLKLQWPHRESEHEAAALMHWDGDGAIRLLEHDPGLDALLVERCVPGAPLSSIPQSEAMEVLADLLPRLWKPAGETFRPLAEEAAHWADELVKKWSIEDQPLEKRLREVTLEALDTLPSTQGEQVLLHQDLHGENILSAQREPWLVIDPKPLAGEREFGLASIVRSSEFGKEPDDVIYRLDTLSERLRLDRERGRLWSIAQTIAWSSGEHSAGHIETVTRLLDA